MEIVFTMARLGEHGISPDTGTPSQSIHLGLSGRCHRKDLQGKNTWMCYQPSCTRPRGDKGYPVRNDLTAGSFYLKLN